MVGWGEDGYWVNFGQTVGPVTFAGAGTTGYVPDPTSETGRFLGDNGTWVAPLVAFQVMVYAEGESIAIAISHWMYATGAYDIEQIFAECEDAAGYPIVNIRVNGVAGESITLSTAGALGSGRYGFMDVNSVPTDIPQTIARGDLIQVQVTDDGLMSATTSKGLILTIYARVSV